MLALDRIARLTCTCLLSGAVVFAAALDARAAEEWPQFRGPGGQGHATATGLPTTWSEDENLAWKTPISGKGHSSPVIDGNQIWLTTALEDHRLQAISVDRTSGQLLREIDLFQPAELPHINAKNSYASPTPIIEGGRLYLHFGALGTACLNTATGEVLWRNEELKVDHKEGPGSSPTLWQDLLIIPCDGIDKQFVAALDKATGKIVWKAVRPGPLPSDPDMCKAYSTPLVIQAGSAPQLISTAADRMQALDPRTGRELWAVAYTGFSNVPRPILGDGLVYICTGYMKPELWAIRLGGVGDVTASHVAWKVARGAPANPSPILLDGLIYMVSDQGIVSCLDALTGDDVWVKRLGGNFSASPVAADGKLYFCSEEGETFVLAPGRKYELLATNALANRMMASPAVVDRALYLRTDDHLYRIEQAQAR